jgi:hypothetical protein
VPSIPGSPAIEITMGLAISLAVYLDRRTLAQNHLILASSISKISAS